MTEDVWVGWWNKTFVEMIRVRTTNVLIVNRNVNGKNKKINKSVSINPTTINPVVLVIGRWASASGIFNDVTLSPTPPIPFGVYRNTTTTTDLSPLSVLNKYIYIHTYT